ncbi:MAG: hypothetical protein IJW20_01285 [Clostridia bacterium]|nr:hypothetical protein [Clostridia bacterium]
MKNKVLGKLLMAVILLYVLISAFSNVKAITLKEMEAKANNFINAGAANQNINYNNVTKEFSDLGQILTMIGAGVMVGITTYMGIKYLTAGPEAQAKLKVQLIGVVVSGMVIFGAYYIWKIVLKIVSTF